MIILPAIDLYESRAVRLLRGDYSEMTVYSDTPAAVAREFYENGARELHVVDLEGARDGTTANFDTVRKIVHETDLKVEVGGGIRSAEVIERYLSIGAMRVILGTAAITKPGFVADMVKLYGGRIAVSVDFKDGLVAIKGWTETSDYDALSFCRTMEDIGVKTIICTDISKDGMLGGTNMELYKTMSESLSVNIIASGGVTSIDEIKKLADMKIYGAILGKALYAGALKLRDAVDAAAGKSI